MLEFQHIIQVNDLNDINALVISRAQLWQGLVLRARNPEKFNQALQCESSDIDSNQFVRKISAGDTQFTEQVVMHPQSKIATNTLPGSSGIAAQSSALIEEPQPNSLFVRFSYRRELDRGTDSVNVAEYLKAAYVQLDHEAIAFIRILAQSENDNSALN
ncbi:MAG: hypothetical protein ACI95C_002700 [Pseudohongiellaceae bacterium]